MATNTAVINPAARQNPRQIINSLKKTVNWNDQGIGAGLPFANGLPMGAFILSVLVEIVTAFNAGTTNVLTAGTNASTYNDTVAAGDVNEAAAGVTAVTRALGRSLAAAADVVPYALYSQTGTAATAGQAVITMIFEGGWSS